MSQLTKPIETWQHIDLQRFVDESAEESLILEFKRELSLTNKKARREFAKDVSAFANTAGGWLIFGIDELREDNSAPVASAVTPFTVGDLASQAENIIFSAVSPPPSVRLKRIEVPGGECMVVRIEPSTSAVHQVIGYDDFRFYRRVDYAARPMSEPELRTAFANVAALQTRVRARFDEIKSIAATHLSPGHCMIALVPHAGTFDIDPTLAIEAHQKAKIFEQTTLNALSPARHGAMADLSGNYWTLLARDGSHATSVPLREELYPNHILKETLELLTAAKQTASDFHCHSSWEVYLRIEPRSPIKLYRASHWCTQNTISTEEFEDFLTMIQLLEDPEPPLSRIFRKLYQSFGMKDAPPFDASGKIKEAVRAEIGRM